MRLTCTYYCLAVASFKPHHIYTGVIVFHCAEKRERTKQKLKCIFYVLPVLFPSNKHLPNTPRTLSGNRKITCCY